jgi:hypothetical protein
MADDWKPAEEEQEVPAGAQAFLDEVKELTKEAEPERKEAEEPKSEEPKTDEPKTEPPQFTKHEDTGFIKDLKNATPEDYQRRISYLYAKVKDNERNWDEAKKYQKNLSEEIEKFRSQHAKDRIARTEAELDADQVKVIDLLDRNSPNYNAAEGAKLLRELTRKDAELRQEREAEDRRVKETKTKADDDNKTREDAARIINEWAATKEYAKEGHPMYGHVRDWLKKAYETAPAHVTVTDIVHKAGEVFDAHVAKAQQTQPKQDKPGAGLTVSQVIGTTQTKPAAPSKANLTAQQRHIAEKLFLDPDKGISKEKAYQLYAEGL